MPVTFKPLLVNAAIDPRGRLTYVVEVNKPLQWRMEHPKLEPPPDMKFPPAPGDVVANTWDAEYAVWIASIPVIKQQLLSISAIIANEKTDIMTKAKQAQEIIQDLGLFIANVEAKARDVEAKSNAEAFRMRQELLQASKNKFAKN